MAQRSILKLTTLHSLASGLVGIFFVFFIQEVFGLNNWQIISWMSFFFLVFGLLVYPLNAWAFQRGIRVKSLIALGLLFDLFFYTILATGWNNSIAFGLLSLCFLLHLIFFWPNFNYLSTKSSDNKNRGNFLGNLQIIRIGIGIITPLITGFLLQKGEGQWVLGATILLFGATLLQTSKLPNYPPLKLQPWSKNKKNLIDIFKDKGHAGGLIADIAGVQMWIIWPLYFKALVGSYAIMGVITSFVALLEIGTSKFIGKITDKYGARAILKYGIWTRAFEFWVAALYIKFSPLWFLALTQSAGSVLGPLYQIPFEHRLMSLSEETMPKNKEMDFFLVREIYLGLGRFIYFGISAGFIYLWGLWGMALTFIVAGICTLGARRF